MRLLHQRPSAVIPSCYTKRRVFELQASDHHHVLHGQRDVHYRGLGLAALERYPMSLASTGGWFSGIGEWAFGRQRQNDSSGRVTTFRKVNLSGNFRAPLGDTYVGNDPVERRYKDLFASLTFPSRCQRREHWRGS